MPDLRTLHYRELQVGGHSARDIRYTWRAGRHCGFGYCARTDVLAAPAQDQRAAAVMPDGEADVVADDGRRKADDADRDHVEPARARIDRGGDEDGLAGHGDTEVPNHDEQQDGPVAEVIEGAGQGVEGPRQMRWRPAGEHAHDQPGYVRWLGLAVVAGLSVRVTAARLDAARRTAVSSKRYGAAFGTAVPLKGEGPVAAAAAIERSAISWMTTSVTFSFLAKRRRSAP